MKLDIKDFTIGLDPEFFLKKDGKNISAHDIVPGNKLTPHKLKHCAIQADGTAVEFNTHPARSQKEFVDALHNAFNDIRKLVPKDCAFDFSPSVIYDKEYFDKLPGTAIELGCQPDYSAARNGLPNPKPKPSALYREMRTAAAHIHVGWPGEKDPKNPYHIEDCCTLVNNMDGWFSSWESIWDKDTRRRQLYGAPGAFRPKTYGVEYRVLSNAWLRYPNLWPWIYDSCMGVIDRTLRGLSCTRMDDYGKTVVINKEADKSKYPGVKTWHYYPIGYYTHRTPEWMGIDLGIGTKVDKLNALIHNQNRGMPRFPDNWDEVELKL